jgi:hypothetical protein
VIVMQIHQVVSREHSLLSRIRSGLLRHSSPPPLPAHTPGLARHGRRSFPVPATRCAREVLDPGRILELPPANQQQWVGVRTETARLPTAWTLSRPRTTPRSGRRRTAAPRHGACTRADRRAALPDALTVVCASHSCALSPRRGVRARRRTRRAVGRPLTTRPRRVRSGPGPRRRASRRGRSARDRGSRARSRHASSRPVRVPLA